MTQCIDFQSRSSSLDMPTLAFSNIFIKDSLIDSNFLKFYCVLFSDLQTVNLQ